MQNYGNIPPPLRERGAFCCWRYEEKNGRKTKIPYDPTTGQWAQTNNPGTFVDFESARQMPGDYDGVGFLITGGLFVIDCDHCRNADGTLTGSATEIVEMFSGCHAEWSPSGNGLHIIGSVAGFQFDKKKYWMNNRSLSVEIYISGATNRFMTLTGDVYRQGGLPDCTQALQGFLDNYMRRGAPPVTAAPSEEPNLPDDTIITKATYARNGVIFQKLWGEDFSGYASQSEADLALCGILAFWCNRDISQMDRLFRQSGLYREKWDRMQSDSTYGRITLEKAAGDAKSTYHPPKKKNAPNTDNPDLREMKPESNPRYPWSDLGNGRLFADYCKSVARYVPERKLRYFFNGSRWIPDLEALKTKNLLNNFVGVLWKYARTIEDEKKRTDYMSYCVKWERNTFRETVVKEAQVYYPIQMDEFDTDIFAFNCTNGTLHLNVMEFRPHNSEDKITKISPVKYDPNARFKRWDDFIVEVMSGDAEKACFLQKAMGYAISGDTQYECMFVLHGSMSRNGKGTLCESILRVMGDYGIAVKPETIALKQQSNSSSPSEDIARLAGIRFANISEPSKGLVLNAAQIKSMTGHDTLNARFLHENSFDFMPQFKLYVNTNHLPIVTDMTVFKSNRIHVIPFERRSEEDEQDHTLKAEFTKKKNQSAILNWLVEGYRMLREEGLAAAPSVSSATSSYWHDSDKVGKFIEEMLEPDEGAELRTSAVYSAYQKWCRRNGYKAEGAGNLNNALQTVARIERRRPRGGGGATTMLYGFRLLQPDSGQLSFTDFPTPDDPQSEM